MISSGNEAVVGYADYLYALARDPGTHVIAGYLEGAADPGKLVRALEEAQQQVLDEDLVAAAYHAAFGGHLQVALARGVQGLNQLLQVDVDHFICP